MKLHLSFLPRVALLLAALACGARLESRAATLYTVNIDTSGLSGLSGSLAFDLIAGDADMANNTASIGGLATDGTLGDASNVALTDVSFFNEELRDIVFGSYLKFTLSLTESYAASGFGFDQFSFFLLDPGTFLSLVDTTDGTGAQALFAIDIDGGAGGNASVFSSLTPDVAWTVTAQTSVPDGGSTLLLTASALAGLLAWTRSRRFALA